MLRYDFKVIVDGGYHSGGGGYLISKESMSRLANQLKNDSNWCQNTGIEDVDVNKCMRRLNITTENSTDEYGRERYEYIWPINHLSLSFLGHTFPNLTFIYMPLNYFKVPSKDIICPLTMSM